MRSFGLSSFSSAASTRTASPRPSAGGSRAGPMRSPAIWTTDMASFTDEIRELMEGPMAEFPDILGRAGQGPQSFPDEIRGMMDAPQAPQAQPTAGIQRRLPGAIGGVDMIAQWFTQATPEQRQAVYDFIGQSVGTAGAVTGAGAVTLSNPVLAPTAPV